MLKSNVTTSKENNYTNPELVSRILQSFEALEETLGLLKLEEPLFITYIAKKSFANTVKKSSPKKIHHKPLVEVGQVKDIKKH